MSDTIESEIQSSGQPSLASESTIAAVSLVDIEVVVNYIKRVVPALLEDNNIIHPSLESLLKSEASLEKLKKFISDGQMRSLLIQRSSSKGLIVFHLNRA
jgi:dynein heavy chain 1